MLASLPLATILAVSGFCGLAGALARHGQGGAWRRYQALILFGMCQVPMLYSYGWNAHHALDYVIGALLIGLFYADMTLKQEFGNLWLGLARNAGPILMLFCCAGVWEVLLGLPIIFLTMKWAKEPHDFDSHKVFEYVLGGVTGFAWGYAPLVRAW